MILSFLTGRMRASFFLPCQPCYIELRESFFCSPEALTAVDFSLFNKYNQNRGYPSVAEAGNQHMHSWSSPNQCRPLEMFVSGDLLLSLLLL